MRQNPQVSILIPAFNSEKWLKETIDSAIYQSWQNKEIIILDDGSTDNSYVIAKKYETNNVKVIKSHQNEGQTATLNKLYKEAQGDFIQYLDSDDVLALDKVEIQLKRLFKCGTNLSLANCKWARFYNDDISTADFYDHMDYKDYNHAIDWLLDSWNGYGTMPPTAWLFPRYFTDQVGFWDESLTLNNDNEYYSRMVTVADRILFCSNAKIYYRSGNPSLSSRIDENSLQCLYNVCEKSTKNILRFDDSNRTREACANLWQSFVYRCYPYSLDMVRKGEMKVHEYGGSDLKLGGRKTIKILRNIIGWKITKKLELKYRKFFYNT